jgi:bifunctional non-homologous end joining protein LigD
VEVSRPAKILFPDDGITKLDLAEYYAAVGSVMLPHIRGRPVAMERYPDGLRGGRFFQKEVARSIPGWVGTADVRKERGRLTQVVCDDVATLVYLADQACITPHVWLSRADRPDHPDQLIFDLDPPEGGFSEARRTAIVLRDLLAELKLPCVPKTTGGKGVHVMVPLNRGADFAVVREFARAVAGLLVARFPGRLTTEQRKDKRRGRLFVDVMRNAYAQHAAAPYAVRARPGAPVATPLHWSEVEDARLRPERFSMRAVRRRLERDGDPWGRLRGRSLREPSRILREMPSGEAA